MRIALGTVQWGMNYGISNINGIPDNNELKNIFLKMDKVRINTLDTASHYGSAEKRISQFIKKKHKIISKVNPSSLKISIKNQCQKSLSNVGIPKFYGYLLNNPSNVIENENIWNELKELKRLGLVNKIGYSVYNPLELDILIEKKIIPDIIQLPFNILDRRFAAYFEKLKNNGVEIHVRSVFLQGVLIDAYKKCPNEFEKWIPLWEKYRSWINYIGVSPVEACLRHVLSFKLIDKIIIGVTKLSELEEIINAQKRSPLIAPNDLSSDDDFLINPLKWPITKRILLKKH